MKTRIMVGAFLVHKNKVLLIHRSMQKKLAPGMWSCIGGHMEQDELNNPIKTCYREIEEETGITKDLIENLQLRYITTRKVDNEIRTGYYFIGDIMADCNLHECNEGSLHWVDLFDISKKDMSFSIKQITTHWISNPLNHVMYLCGINNENNKVTWMEL